jgi:hypothetical protein
MNLMEMTENLRGMSSDYMEVGGKAISDLKQQFRDFGSLSKGEVKTLGETIAVLEKRGAASKDGIDVLTNLTKAIGFTADESSQLLYNQIAIAGESQRPVNEQLSEFSMGLTNLARFGKDSVRILSRMKLDANKAGVELRTLTGLAEKADTFEGAAQLAQAFNYAVAAPFGAALINPIELIGRSMDEKISYIQEKYRMAGSPVLSPRVIREFSAAAQLPENEMLKIFKSEGSKVGAKGDDVMNATTSLEEQKEMIAKSADMQEKINTAMKKFADNVLEMVGGPDGLIKIVDGITSGINFLADNIYTVGSGLAFIYGVQLATSFRGASIANPEYVSSAGVPGAAPAGGKGGTLLKLLAIGGGLAGAGMLANSMTEPAAPTAAAPAQTSGGGVQGASLGGPAVPGSVPAFKSTPIRVNKGNDTPGSMSGGGTVRIGAGKSVPKMVTSNYVLPQIDLVHKDDKLYFAKNDGALMQKINEAKSKAGSNSDKKQPTVIRISKREFKQMISDALGEIV